MINSAICAPCYGHGELSRRVVDLVSSYTDSICVKYFLLLSIEQLPAALNTMFVLCAICMCKDVAETLIFLC